MCDDVCSCTRTDFLVSTQTCVEPKPDGLNARQARLHTLGTLHQVGYWNRLPALKKLSALSIPLGAAASLAWVRDKSACLGCKIPFCREACDDFAVIPCGDELPTRVIKVRNA